MKSNHFCHLLGAPRCRAQPGRMGLPALLSLQQARSTINLSAMLLAGNSLHTACGATKPVFLLQKIIHCALQAMPSCLVPCDSPALLKALASIIKIIPARISTSFMTEEAFAVPIHQVRWFAQRVSCRTAKQSQCNCCITNLKFDSICTACPSDACLQNDFKWESHAWNAASCRQLNGRPS